MVDRRQRSQEAAAVAWTRAGGRALRARDDDGDAVVGDGLGTKQGRRREARPARAPGGRAAKDEGGDRAEWLRERGMGFAALREETRERWIERRGWARVNSGEVGLAGPAWLVRPKRPAGLAPLSSLLLKQRKRKEREEKKRLEKEFGHGDYFPGLTKICLFRENRKSHD